MSESIEQLSADLAANLEEVALMGPLTSAQDVVNHLKNTLWPFMQNVVQNLAEVDEIAGDMYEGAEDTLQPETAGIFSALVLGTRELCNELEKLTTDPKIVAGIKKIRIIAQKAEETLEEITIEVDEEEDDEDEAPIAPSKPTLVKGDAK